MAATPAPTAWDRPPPGRQERDAAGDHAAAAERAPDSNPWPTWPLIYRTSCAHEEGGERLFAVNTEKFVGDERRQRAGARAVRGPDGRRPIPQNRGNRTRIPADLVLLAMGFVSTDGAAEGGFLDSLGVEVDSRGRAIRDAGWKSTADGVFIAGDAGRGQSLIVWAIAEGRAAAAAVDAYLSGSSALPAPIHPDTVALAVR